MNNSNILISLSAYKEAENIVKITDKIRSLFPTIKILIINDESYDNTEKLIQEKNDENITIIQSPKKLGLGTAHKLSLVFAIKNNYDFLITMDADFSHDPDDLPRLLYTCAKHGADVCVGSRYVPGGKIINWPKSRYWLSFYASLYVRFILGIKIASFFHLYFISLSDLNSPT